MIKENKTTTRVLQDIIIWIQENCFNDETTLAITSHIQCEINKIRRKIKC